MINNKEVKNDKMKILMGIIICMFFLTIVSAVHYQVDVSDSIGAGTGDNVKYINITEPDPDPEPDPEPAEQDNYSRKVKESIYIDDKNRFNSGIDLTDTIDIENGSNTTDTAEKPKVPVDLTPYIIWGIIIICLVALVGGSWYIYQIYFY